MPIVHDLVADQFGSHLGKYSERLKLTRGKEVLAQAPCSIWRASPSAAAASASAPTPSAPVWSAASPSTSSAAAARPMPLSIMTNDE